MAALQVVPKLLGSIADGASEGAGTVAVLSRIAQLLQVDAVEGRADAVVATHTAVSHIDVRVPVVGDLERGAALGLQEGIRKERDHDGDEARTLPFRLEEGLAGRDATRVGAQLLRGEEGPWMLWAFFGMRPVEPEGLRAAAGHEPVWCTEQWKALSQCLEGRAVLGARSHLSDHDALCPIQLIHQLHELRNAVRTGSVAMHRAVPIWPGLVDARLRVGI